MSYSFFMSIFNIPIFILQLVKQTRTDETPHLYICSSSSDPRDQCFAAGSWGDWTTNVGSVLWLHPMGHVCSTDFVRTGPAGLGCTAVLLYMI